MLKCKLRWREGERINVAFKHPLPNGCLLAAAKVMEKHLFLSLFVSLKFQFVIIFTQAPDHIFFDLGPDSCPLLMSTNYNGRVI